MTSRRFSLIDVSIELNFCLTCFRGSLFNASRKKVLNGTQVTFLLSLMLLHLHSSSPHVCQELLKHLLPVYGPKPKAAWRVAGVGNALVQGPVLVEAQTEAEYTKSRKKPTMLQFKQNHHHKNENMKGYSYSNDILMQSIDNELSSSSFRWLCRETCRCIVAMSVTYFMLKEEKQP